MFFLPLSCRNLELLVSLPGGDSVQGFFLVTLLVEVAAIPALRVNINPKISKFIQHVHPGLSMF